MDTDAGNLDKSETEDAGVVSAGAFFAGLARGKRDCVSCHLKLCLSFTREDNLTHLSSLDG